MRRTLIGAAVISLGLAMGTAAHATVVIDETFDNGDSAGSPPTNVGYPGTWLPNYFVTNDVPGVGGAGHTGPDIDLQAEVQNSSGNLVGQYVHGRGGGPEFDLDGYLKADQAATTPGLTVRGNFNIRMVYGEGLVGLANDTQTLADGTDNTDPNYDWLPSPTGAMLFGLWLGAGYGASGGAATMYSSYANDRSLIGLSTAMGVNMPVAPTSVGWLRFDFEYTVGEAFLDYLRITSLDDAGATYDNAELVRLDTGGPVPVMNAGGVDGWFQGDGDKPDGAIRNTNFITDDIFIEVIPEPSTLSLLAAGALLMAVVRRRRA